MILNLGFLKSNESIFKVSLEESGVITICDISCLFIEDFEEVRSAFMLAFVAVFDVV
jgi:hypothetical protein